MGYAVRPGFVLRSAKDTQYMDTGQSQSGILSVLVIRSVTPA